MVNKTTSFKRNDKGKKGNSKKSSKPVANPTTKPKAGPKPETECYYCKGLGHSKRNCPKYLSDKKAAKEKSGIFDIHVIDVYLTNSLVVPRYSIPVLLLIFATRRRNCGINEGWRRMK